MLKIFISYSQKEDKKIAGELKRYFEEYDTIECFVAHDDIAPGSEWEQEILKSLENSDFFMPIQTEHLRDSYWCQQEAGYAVARKIRIVPLIPDSIGIDPIGFYAKFQGFKIKVNDLKDSVKSWLILEGIITDDESDELKKRMLIFKSSGTYYEAGVNTRLLFELENQFTKVDIIDIARFTVKNNQILDSYDAQSYLRLFFSKNAKVIPKEYVERFFRQT